jgi:hypothetical protein
MRLIADREGWFFDNEGNKRFRITEFVQPNHPIIKGLANGKTIEQISEYWRDNFNYDDNPPFRLLRTQNGYEFDCPEGFTPDQLIQYVYHTKKADCFSGSCFFTSMMNSQGYEAEVVLGKLIRVNREGKRRFLDWVKYLLTPT